MQLPACYLYLLPSPATQPEVSTPAQISLDSKPALKLPRTQDEWNEANTFQEHVVPDVLQLATPEAKIEALCEGVYNYFAEKYGTLKPQQHNKQRKQEKHDRALKKVKQLKNEARKKLRKAKDVQPRVSSHLQARSSTWCENTAGSNVLPTMHSEASKARQSCHRHFWRFAKELLDGNGDSQTQPQLDEKEAFSFFQRVYDAEPHEFSRPEWMPPPPSPDIQFCCDEISADEIQAAIKRMKNNSSPSPLDRITYLIFKRCPSLWKALCDLVNASWSSASIPTQWKQDVVKLIGKSSAADDPTTQLTSAPLH